MREELEFQISRRILPLVLQSILCLSLAVVSAKCVKARLFMTWKMALVQSNMKTLNL